MRGLKRTSSSLLVFFLMVPAICMAKPIDPNATAEQCRQLALKIDWLSRYQDRAACIKNLDGLNVYMASRYILNERYNDAKTLINESIIQTNFAIDIGCYGQTDLTQVVLQLGAILNIL